MPHYFKIFQSISEIQPEQESMHINAESASFSQHNGHLDMANTCAKLFKILPCIRELQTGHEWLHYQQSNLKCDPDL